MSTKRVYELYEERSVFKIIATNGKKQWGRGGREVYCPVAEFYDKSEAQVATMALNRSVTIRNHFAKGGSK